MGVDVNLSGISDLIEELEMMTVNTAKAAGEILSKAAQPILQELQSTTAFEDRSGNLRRSFKISKLRNSRMNKNGRWYIWVGDVDREAPHGWLLEYGTSRMPARPFIQPALERHEGEVFEAIKEGLREALGK